MKILHVVYSCIPGNYRGGIAKIVFELAKAQAALGNQVEIYATNYNSTVRVAVPLDEPVDCDGVRIRYFAAVYPRWALAPQMKRAILGRDFRFDVVHAHNTYLAPNLYARKAKERFGIRFSLHSHGAFVAIRSGSDRIKILRKLLYVRLVERRNLRAADLIFANSESEAKRLREEAGSLRVLRVQNGVTLPNLELLRSEGVKLRARLGLTEEDRALLYLGRIVPKKGLHLLLEAFGRVRQQLPRTWLLLAGDREQDRSYSRILDEITRREGFADSVRWLGFLSEEGKSAALGAADLCSHVSESEGMSMSVLEAMAAGLPTIVSPGCSMTSAVAAGALAESEFNVEALAAGLGRLLSDWNARKQMAAEGRRHVSVFHRWEDVARSVTDAYATVAK